MTETERYLPYRIRHQGKTETFMTEKKLRKGSPEDKLLNALGMDLLTPEEAKYLKWLLPRQQISFERRRELFLKRFPKTKWIQHRGNQ